MATEYTIPRFHFFVRWGGVEAGFTEVSGLNVEVAPIDYREGDSIQLNIRKLPGLRKYGNITLKRGVIQSCSPFQNWLEGSQSNGFIRQDMLISLLNEKHEPVIVWKVLNAFPVKVETADLTADANEVAIETLEIAHEGIRVQDQ